MKRYTVQNTEQLIGSAKSIRSGDNKYGLKTTDCLIEAVEVEKLDKRFFHIQINYYANAGKSSRIEGFDLISRRNISINITYPKGKPKAILSVQD